MNKRIVITGLGILAPNGKGREEYVDAVKSTNSMISPELSITERLTTDLKKD